MLKIEANGTIRTTTAGYSDEERLSVDVGPAKCGVITDGVAFWHDREGAWVVDYADLVAIVELATRKRSESATAADAVDPVVPSVTD